MAVCGGGMQRLRRAGFLPSARCMSVAGRRMRPCAYYGGWLFDGGAAVWRVRAHHRGGEGAVARHIPRMLPHPHQTAAGGYGKAATARGRGPPEAHSQGMTMLRANGLDMGGWWWPLGACRAQQFALRMPWAWDCIGHDTATTARPPYVDRQLQRRHDIPRPRLWLRRLWGYSLPQVGNGTTIPPMTVRRALRLRWPVAYRHGGRGYQLYGRTSVARLSHA